MSIGPFVSWAQVFSSVLDLAMAVFSSSRQQQKAIEVGTDDFVRMQSSARRLQLSLQSTLRTVQGS